MFQSCFLLCFVLILTASTFTPTTSVGRIPMKHSTSNHGGLILDIPIEVIHGSGKTWPKLHISYDSHRMVNGILGEGFYLKGTPAIHRCPKNIFNDGFIQGINFQNDSFCYQGERLVAIKGVYGEENTEYRPQSDKTMKVVSMGRSGNGPEHFILYTKMGLQMEFGSSEGSRLEVLPDKTVSMWGRNHVEDTFGNFYTVSYDENLRAVSIDYTGNSKGGVKPYARVQFEYEERPDVIERWTSGVSRSHDKRLAKIRLLLDSQASGDYTLGWEYIFGYVQSKICGQSLLGSVIKCASDTDCLAPTTFTWSENDAVKFPKQDTNQLLEISEDVTMGNLDMDRVHVGNFGGSEKGKADIYFITGYATSSAANNKPTPDILYLNNGDGSFTTLPALAKPIGDGVPLASVDIARYKFIDWNSNGFVDILYVTAPLGKCADTLIYLNDGSGKFDDVHTIKGPNTCLSAGVTNATVDLKRYRFGDFAGNGLMDMYYINGFNSKEYDDIYVNQGDGKFVKKQGLLTEIRYPFLELDVGRIKIMDVTGDGKMDVYYVNGADSAQADTIWVNLDSDKPPSVINGPPTFLSKDVHRGSLDLDRIKFGDFNGDGLTDVYYVQGFGATKTDSIFINHGNGEWSEIPGLNTKVGDSIDSASVDISRIRSMSFNKDSMSDIYIVQGSSDTKPVVDDIYVSLGTGEFKKFPGPATKISAVVARAKMDVNRMHMADYNGNSFTSIIRLNKGDTKTKDHHPPPKVYDSLFSNDFSGPWLSRIVDGYGDELQVEYKSLGDKTVYESSSVLSQYPVRSLSTSFYVVSSVKKSDGVGGLLQNTYFYKDGKYHQQGLGFLGFREFHDTMVQTGIMNVRVFDQDYNKYLHPRQISRTVIKNGKVIHSHDSEFNATTSVTTSDKAKVFTVLPTRIVDVENDVDGTFKSETTKIVGSYDEYLNEVSVKKIMGDEWGNLTVYHDNEYVYNVEKWILTMVSKTVVRHSVLGPYYDNSTSTKTSTFVNDENTGVALTTTVYPDQPEFCFFHDLKYNVFGSMTQKTLEDCGKKEAVVSITTYDEKGRFIVKREDPLGGVEKFLRDEMYGTAATRIDKEGNQITTKIDAYGRTTHITVPEGTKTSEFSWCDETHNTCPENGVYFVTETSNVGTKTVKYFSSKEKVIRLVKPGFNAPVIVDTLRDAFGNVIKKSNPYHEGDSILWSQHFFDDFHRQIRSLDVENNESLFSYTGLVVKHVNALSQTTYTHNNMFSHPVLIVDNLENIATYYYNADKKLVRLCDSKSNCIVNKFNVLGRKLQENDTDRGITTYEYDARGNLVRKNDVVMHYDKLDRMVSKQTKEGTSTWKFDERRCVTKISSIVHSSNFSKSYVYDDRCLLQSVTTTIDGNDFTSKYEHDEFGRKNKKVFAASGVGICFDFNSNGFISKIKCCETGRVFVEVLEQSPFGATTKLKYGNGITVSKGYTVRNELESIDSILDNFQGYQNLSYSYDPVGKMSKRTDHRQNLEESFAYDDLNRLTSMTVNGGSKYETKMEYDVLGNVIYKSDVGNYTYDAEKIHAATNVGGSTTLSYDDRGNLLTDGTRKFTFSSEDKPTVVTFGDYQQNIRYGPHLKRFRKQLFEKGVWKSTTYYIDGDMQVTIVSGSAIFDIHHFIGKTIMLRQNGTRFTDFYLLVDHLGSTDVITDSKGGVVEERSYDSFGLERDSKTWMPKNHSAALYFKKGYTGHEFVINQDFVHMNGRVYLPAYARFISPDPHVQNEMNMQDFNRYTYCLNNPLRSTDPTGYEHKEKHVHHRRRRHHSMSHGIKRSSSKASSGKGNALRNPGIQNQIKMSSSSLSPSLGDRNTISQQSQMTGYSAHLSGESFGEAASSASLQRLQDSSFHSDGDHIPDNTQSHFDSTIAHGVVGGQYSGGTLGEGFWASSTGSLLGDQMHSQATSAADHGMVSGVTAKGDGGSTVLGAMGSKLSSMMHDAMSKFTHPTLSKLNAKDLDTHRAYVVERKLGFAPKGLPDKYPLCHEGVLNFVQGKGWAVTGWGPQGNTATSNSFSIVGAAKGTLGAPGGDAHPLSHLSDYTYTGKSMSSNEYKNAVDHVKSNFGHYNLFFHNCHDFAHQVYFYGHPERAEVYHNQHERCWW